MEKGGKKENLELLPLKVHLLTLTLLHSEQPKLHRVLAILSVEGLTERCLSHSDERLVYSQEFEVLSLSHFLSNPYEPIHLL